MLRPILPAALIVLTLPLAGCNEAIRGPDPAVAATAPTAFRLPPDAPCANEISQYQSVVKSDLQTGNVEQKVYDQIEKELARAANACSAGKGGEAHAIVAGSKARHGYRA